MKIIILFAIILMGCSGNESGNIRNSIPGVYTRHFEAQYSVGDDTLYIAQLNGGNTYTVIRKSTYRSIKNKVIDQPQQKIESWMVIYDYRDKSLYEQKRERMLTPLPDSNELLVGGSTYLKIK
ncbi:MAG: hypothetical protein M3R72_10495 [Bacteroidota bacterium]|nr:hypothetical protein [Bacteroidota bacterium]